MSRQKMNELEQELNELRRKDPRADLKPILDAALAAAEDDEERASLLARLASESHLELTKLTFNDKHKGKFEAAETLIRKCIALQPDEPYHAIRLAEHFHYYAVDLKKAFQAINAAIKKAEAKKAFVRQAHSARIRIALEIKDYKSVEKSLKTLISYNPPSDSPDTSLEGDFLRKIPDGKVNKDLVTRYRSIL